LNWITVLHVAPVLWILGAANASAASLNMWSSAVVLGDSIRLDEICGLNGPDAETEQRLRAIFIADAPPPGGSLVIHIDRLRAALASSGANMAALTFRGATQCSVVRPMLPSTNSETLSPEGQRSAGGDTRPRDTSGQGSAFEAQSVTLRCAVTEHFNIELARFGGRPELIFDRSAEQALTLTAPKTAFHVRHRGGPLGLVSVDVDVPQESGEAKSVALLVNVSMVRSAVIAQRAISEGATIRPADISVAAMVFSRVDEACLDRVAAAVGQRARQFIPAGTLVLPSMLEEVPLVLRGQLVTLTSHEGTVRVVTSGKASGDGKLGEIIKVRATDGTRIEYDGVVVGPGEIRIQSAMADVQDRIEERRAGR